MKYKESWTMDLDAALAYKQVGWKITSMHEVVLPGINKSYTECSVSWDSDKPPIKPDELPSISLADANIK